MANLQSASPPGGMGDVSPSDNAPGASANAKMRKRTKTGCLTCRKRRIKCGEERPTCGNCIKSKRQCEGYNQRVVFKTPIENWPNHPGHVSTIQYHTSMLPGTRNQPYRPPQPHTQAHDSPLTSVQPRLMTNFDFSAAEHGQGGGLPTPQQVHVAGVDKYTHETSYQQPLPSPHHQQPLQSPHHHAHITTSTASYFPQPSPVHKSPPPHFDTEPSVDYRVSQQYGQSQTPYQHIPATYDNSRDMKPAVSQAVSQHSMYQHQAITQPEEHNSYRSHSSVSPQNDHYPAYTEPQSASQRYNSNSQSIMHSTQVNSAELNQAGHYSYPTAVSHADFSHSHYSSVPIPMHDMSTDVKYMPQPVLEQPVAISRTRQGQPRLLLDEFSSSDYTSSTHVLDEAAIEVEDDDYWDVQSDEDMLDVEHESEESAILASKDFDNIRRIHAENSDEVGIRRYNAFLYDGILAHYRPEYAASPLRNPKTARVFAHYIHVTGPTLSVFERNPRNSTLIFEGPTPAVQQGLWTYVLPIRALGNQGLLHAMLALASLQIARLQRVSATPSYKHYAYALKRLKRSLGHRNKRLSIPTLATSLLLAYYEVWTAEHVKWSTHLVGAAQLVSEFDFRSLTREARRMKAAQTAREKQFPYQNPEMLIDQRLYHQKLNDNTMIPDENLVSTIVGGKLNHGDLEIMYEEYSLRQGTRFRLPGNFDLRSYETLQDLFWWYCRNDAIQSIVSGNPLIMTYRRWSDCPPRAPLNRPDALYGSHDHMILLIGRIADFTVRDRARKLRQVEADGGWRPRPGMPGFGSMGTSPSMSTGPTGERLTKSTPVDPPLQMQGGPTGWTGAPPPSFRTYQHGNSGTPQSSQGHGPSSAATPTFYGMAPARPPAPLSASYANPDFERSPPTPTLPHPKYSDLPAAYNTALKEWNNISAAYEAVAQTLDNTDTFAPLPLDIYPPVPGGTGNMTPFGPAIIHRSYDISIIWTLLYLAKIILLRCHPAMPPAAQMAAGVCAPATQLYAMLIGRITAGMQLPACEDMSPSLGALLTDSTVSLFFAGVQYQDHHQRDWLVTRLLEIDRRTGWASAGIIARGCETAWEKAAEMGRGPPYDRRTRRMGEKGPLVLDPESLGIASTWRAKDNPYTRGARDGVDGPPRDGGKGTGTRESERSDLYDQQAQRDGNSSTNQERGFVVKSRPPPWAMNLLGTEEELRAGIEKVGL